VAAPTSAPPITFTMIVDRPFVFAIQDDATGALLFLGRIVNPQTAA
jgi:serine protease inhibitor